MVTAPSAETDANRHQSARGRNHPSFTLKCISNQGASFTPTSPERLLPARGIISRVGIDVRRYRWGCARLPAAAKLMAIRICPFMPARKDIPRCQIDHTTLAALIRSQPTLFLWDAAPGV